jgi:hypothetical protein
LCSEGEIDGAAIGATETNGHWVNVGDYPYVSSAVAGFYGDEAKPYLASVRKTAVRCGWSEMRIPKLGEEAYGIFSNGDSFNRSAIVFVRTGQVILQVSVLSSTSGSFQSDAIELSQRAAKRIPKSGK